MVSTKNKRMKKSSIVISRHVDVCTVSENTYNDIAGGDILSKVIVIQYPTISYKMFELILHIGDVADGIIVVPEAMYLKDENMTFQLDGDLVFIVPVCKVAV